MKRVLFLLHMCFLKVMSIEVKEFVSFKNIQNPDFTVHTLLKENETEEFVLEIPYGYCYEKDNIITQEGHFLKDPLILTYDRLHLSFPSKIDVTINYYPERVAVISCCYNQSYYHWLLQIVSRIMVLHYSGVKYDRIYVSCKKQGWRIDLLKIILNYYNIAHEKLIMGSAGCDKAIQAEVLIVPSVPLAFNNYAVRKNPKLHQKPKCPKWLLQELRSIFLDNQSDDQLIRESYERIYISRAKAERRKVVNENDLIQELEKRGFKRLYLEDYSIFEQARIFNQARVIVGPHGAGFTNLVFSNPGYVVIELEHFLTNVSQRQFFTELATFTFGIHFQYYVDRVPRKQRNKDMMVSLESFIPFLDDILGSYNN